MPNKTPSKKKNVRVAGKSNSIMSKFNGLPLVGRVALIIVAGVALAAGVTAGYTKYREQELLSKAGSYKQFYGRDVTVFFCKRADYGARGMHIRLIYKNNTREAAPVSFAEAATQQGSVTKRIDQRAWFWNASVIEISVPKNGKVRGGLNWYQQTSWINLADRDLGWC